MLLITHIASHTSTIHPQRRADRYEASSDFVGKSSSAEEYETSREKAGIITSNASRLRSTLTPQGISLSLSLMSPLAIPPPARLLHHDSEIRKPGSLPLAPRFQAELELI